MLNQNIENPSHQLDIGLLGLARTNAPSATTAPAQLTVRLVNDVDGLKQCRSAYQSLLESLGRAETIYFDIEFMVSMNPYFLADDSSGGDRQLYFLFAYRGAQLIGVAPLLREKKRVTRFGVRRIYCYGETNDSLMVSFPQMLVPVEHKADCIKAFVNFLQQHQRDWDVVDLGYLFLHEEISTFQKLVPGCQVQQDPMKSHWADLSLGYESFLKGFSTKRRGNFRRSREKLQSCHQDVRFEKTNRLTEQQIKAVEELHIKRQHIQRKSGKDRYSLFEIPGQKAAFTGSLELFARKNCAQHYLLYADSKLIAFLICYRSRNTTFIQLLAMDDDYHQYSPTKLLVIYAYEQEADDGIEQINFLLGTNPLKEQLAKQEVIHHRVMWQSHRLSSIIRLRLWRFTQSLKRRLKQ